MLYKQITIWGDDEENWCSERQQQEELDTLMQTVEVDKIFNKETDLINYKNMGFFLNEPI